MRCKSNMAVDDAYAAIEAGFVSSIGANAANHGYLCRSSSPLFPIAVSGDESTLLASHWDDVPRVHRMEDQVQDAVHCQEERGKATRVSKVKRGHTLLVETKIPAPCRSSNAGTATISALSAAKPHGLPRGNRIGLCSFVLGFFSPRLSRQATYQLVETGQASPLK